LRHTSEEETVYESVKEARREQSDEDDNDKDEDVQVFWYLDS